MANSSLEGYTWNVPDELYNHLKRIINAYKGDKNVEGYQRLENTLNDRTISYEQLKRIKNFFDSFSGNRNDTEYILNGGSKMGYWVSDTLTKAREGIKSVKSGKMKAGLGNQFIKNHTKNGISTDDIKIKKQTVGSSARKVSDNRGVTEIEDMLGLLDLINENKSDIDISMSEKIDIRLYL